MAGKSSDRKSKKEGRKEMVHSPMESLAHFVLPNSLPCDEVDYPVLINRKVTANWNVIVEESKNYMKEAEEFVQSKQEPVLKSPFSKTETDYIKDELLTTLLTALQETLNKAKIWDAYTREKCFFNGIDWIVQCLWNYNPRYPQRAHSPLHLYNMPWVKQQLKIQPRPYFPKSWLWPEDYAATVIQKTVRQYFVQREEEVQEMRDFWRKLKLERTLPQIDMNPLLARKFASTRSLPAKK